MNGDQFLTDPQAERELVAAILSITNRSRLDEWLPLLEGPEFDDPHLGEIWTVARQLNSAGKRVNQRSIITERDTEPIHARLKKLAGDTTDPHTVVEKTKTVRDLHLKRKLYEHCYEIRKFAKTDMPYSELLEFANDKLRQAEADESDGTVVAIGSVLDEWRESVSRPRENVRIFPTPWSELNDMLFGGMNPGRLYTVGGRPASGKSLVGSNIALHAAEHGRKALLFSLEMSTSEVLARVVASGAEAELGRIMGHNLDDWAKRKIDEYVSTSRDLPLFVCDKPGVTVEWIASQARSVRRQHGLDIIVVDYLQLIKPVDTRLPRQEQVAAMSWALKSLARELDVAIVLAAQLNRQSVTEGRPPEASDLRESGAIEQDSDGIWLIHPVVDANKAPTGEIDLFVRKNRQGKSGSVRLAARTHYAKFSSIAPYDYGAV